MKQIYNNNLLFTVFLSFLLLGTVSVVQASEIDKNIIMQANQERAQAGLKELRENEILNNAAKLKAQDMIANSYFAHTSPKGVDPWHWIQKVNYQYKYAGENLAMNFSSAISAHRAWMKSQSHKENILSDRYTEIGVAVMEGFIDGKQTRVAVQFFGDPLGGAGNGVILQQQQEEKEKVELQSDEVLPASPVEIEEASIKPWETALGNEMIVYAKVLGGPVAVEVHFGNDKHVLQDVGQDRYMSLVSVESFDFKKESIVIKAELGEEKAMFYQLPQDQYLAYVKGAESIEGEAQKIKEQLVVAQLEKNKLINSQDFALFLFMAACLIIICNIWILEKEEERLLMACNSK